MRSLLGITAAAGLAAASLAIGPATGHARAATQAGGVQLTITGMTPRYALAGSTITVSGTVANGTGTALSGLTVELFSASSPFVARSTMDAFIAGKTTSVATSQEGVPVAVKTIPSGGQAGWTASFTSAGAQMAQFGVYPVVATVIDGAGLQRGADRTLLPFWETGQTGFGRLKIGWAWPLIDQPQQQACPALLTNHLAGSVDGGRLRRLLTAGTSAQANAAKVTYVLDPALLTAVNAMTDRSGYQTGGSYDCLDAQRHPASDAARTWLDTLRTAVASAPGRAQITPFANVDVAALTHNGLNNDVKTAYTLGRKSAGAVLGTAVMSDMSFPAGGQADESVLAALAADEPQVTSVVLSSAEMKLYPSGYRDDALSSVNTMVGAPLHVLLADSTITSVLAGASTAGGAGGAFAVEQGFLAETAMIAAQAPQTSRSVVVSPPQNWAPPVKLAENLLKDSSSVPWLRPVSLTGLTTSHDSGGDPRQSLAGKKVSKRELTARYLTGPDGLHQQAKSKDQYMAMLYPPGQAYTDLLNGALASCESAAWRGGGPGGAARVDRLSRYLRHAASQVRIITSSVVQMAGSSGSVPVSIQNKLLQQTIRVRIAVTVQPRPGTASPPLTVGTTKVVTVPPGETVPVTLSLRDAPQGTSTLQLALVSADGTSTPVAKALMIDSTRYGRAILIVIAAAIGLLLLTSVFRSGLRARRRLDTEQNAEAKGEHEPADA